MHPTPVPTVRRPRLSQVLVALLFLAFPLGAAAQTVSTLSMQEQQELAAEQARRQATDRILSAGGGVPLEGSLDATSYIVGPGDVFSVSIGGAVPLQLTPRVTADGTLPIPEVGSFLLSGLTLAEARERVQEELRRTFRNVATSVALAQPRQFYVHVSGEVGHPGRHVAVPVARVEDALSAAMEGGNPLQSFEMQRREYWNYPGLPALRNVEVRRQSGERIVVDLMRYYATGDTDFNPYLRDGDGIYVPTFQSEGEAVFVERESSDAISRGAGDGGERARTTLLDYRPDDTVTTLLLVAGGPELLAQTHTLRLLRTRADGALEAQPIDVQAIRAGDAPDVPLQPRDRLLLPALAARAGAAETTGFVTYPGAYPILVGETTLRDLVEASGGIRPDGLLRGAYLERREPIEPEPDALPAFEALGPEARVARIEQAAAEQTALSDLSFTSRQYFSRELLQYQRVSLDLTNDPASIPAIPLRDGDRFVVPLDPGAILVVGQVGNPGYVPYKEGAAASYYIERAGGRGPAAAETYLRKAGSRVIRSPEGEALASGDLLFVDRLPTADTESLQALSLQEQQLVFQEERERSNRRFQYIQTGLSIIGTAVGLVTTYLLITQESTN